jgi:hypothetical protein
MKKVFTRVGIGFFVAFIIALALATLASIVLIIGAGVGGCATQTFVRNEYIECKVTDKESITQDGEHRYLIYCETKDGETKVFENTDQLIYGKFDSSDVYAGIEIGKTYNFTVSGVRVPIFSWYENIVDYEEVESDVSKETIM